MCARIRKPWLLLVVVLVVGCALPALAAEGRIPIPNVNPVVTPINIVTPGHYILTRNLKSNAPGPLINIAVAANGADVYLDLNGFTLDGTANPASPVIQLNAVGGSTNEVTIRDGAIQGGSNAVALTGAGAGSLRKLVIQNVRAGGTSADTLWIVGDIYNTIIRNCVVADSGGMGIDLCPAPPTAGARQATLEGNLVRNTKDGIWVCNHTAVITRNEVASTVAGGVITDGIRLQNCFASLVTENTIREANGSNCLRLFETVGTKVFDNVLNRCSGNGIVVDSTSFGNLVWKNVVREANNWGIDIAGDYNQVEGNVVTQSGRGLVFEAGAANNVYRSNMARGSLGAACPGAALCADFCNGGGATNNTSGDNFMPNNAAPCN